MFIEHTAIWGAVASLGMHAAVILPHIPWQSLSCHF
jgi:hypothetical protein